MTKKSIRSKPRTLRTDERIIPSQDRDISGLLASLREVILTARQQVLRSVDVVQVRTCWTVGQHIVEFEQGGAARAVYGKRLLADLAENLTAEFGKGFDASNLRYMRLFYQAFPNCDAMRHELSWTHYRSLLKVEDASARLWYMNKSVVRYSVLHGNERLFATKYKLILPSEEELRVELIREQRVLAEQSTEKKVVSKDANRRK